MTLLHPEVLDSFRASKANRFKPPESNEFLAEKGAARPDWDKLLNDVLACKPGKKDASKPGESTSSDAGGGSKAEPTKDAGTSSEASTPKPSSPGSSGGE